MGLCASIIVRCYVHCSSVLICRVIGVWMCVCEYKTHVGLTMCRLGGCPRLYTVLVCQWGNLYMVLLRDNK